MLPAIRLPIHLDALLKETVVKHADRPEAERFWNFPRDAVEEAVVNAIYHRSYEEREPVEVRISPDELVVLSFPGPDRSIAMEELRAGRAVSRRYRNRRIGEFLKELDLTEGRSTGIPKIMRVMRQNGSPPPVFESDEDRTYFLIRLPVHVRAVAEVTSGGESRGRAAGGADRMVSGTGTASPEAHDEAHDEAYDEAHEPLGALERRILELCADGPRRASELLRALGYGTKTGNFKLALAHLLRLSLVEMTLPAAPRSKRQRYRLTDRARKWLTAGRRTP